MGLALLTAAQSASAWTARIDGSTLRIDGTSAAEALEILESGGLIVVRDGSTLDPGLSFSAASISSVEVALGAGSDYLRSSLDLDFTVSGGDGHDQIYLGHGNNDVSGGDGNDTIVTDGGDDVVHGDQGDDTIRTAMGDDTIYGGDGHDTIRGSMGNDVIYGHEFPPYFDQPYQDRDTIYGDEGDDIIFGGPDDDVIEGGDGNDTIHGYSDDSWNLVLHHPAATDGDSITGGPGNDILDGGPKDDIVHGDEDDDSVGGGTGDDELHGGDGDDLIVGGPDDDDAYGNAGIDILVGGSDADHLEGGDGDDVLIAGRSIHGPWEESADRFAAGADSLSGGIGNDHLIAGDGGVDSLMGDRGDDLLIAVDGLNDDRLTGGAGFDSFWIDGTALGELPTDGTAQEEETNLHYVFGFANAADMTFDGDDLADPDAGAGFAYVNLGENPLFPVAGPSRFDISQGGTGDCWLLAALASTAGTRPEALYQAVVPLHDGTFMVEYDGRHFRVDADLPYSFYNSVTDTYSLAFAERAADDALWVALIEKAVAYDRSGWAARWKDDTYDDTTLGIPRAALTALGGEARGIFEWLGDVVTTWSAKKLLNDIAEGLADNQAMTFCTLLDDGLFFPDKLYGFHCYSIINVTSDADGPNGITIYNPHGVDVAYDPATGEIFDGRAASGDPSNGIIWLSKSEFKRSFAAGWEKYSINTAGFGHFLPTE